MWLLLLGCDLAAKPCTTEEQPAVAACFGPIEMTKHGAEPLDFGGEVVEAGVGGWPDGCDAQLGRSAGTSGWWARVEGAGGSAVIGVELGGTSPPAKGSQIAGRGVWQPGEFGPTVGALELVDGAGELLIWVGQAGEVEHLTVPEGLSVGRGAAECGVHDDCGAWEGYATEVEWQGEAVSVPRYATATVGDLSVQVASHELQTTSGGCPDWYVASVLVGAARSN